MAADGAAGAEDKAAVSRHGGGRRAREAPPPSAGWTIRKTASHFTFSFQYLERDHTKGGGGESGE